MINYIQIFGYYILISQLALLVPVIREFTVLRKIIILFFLAIVVIIPKVYLNVNILYILRGVLGEISAASIILILIFFSINFLNLNLKFFEVRTRLINTYSMSLIFLFGLILYASTLGFINVDIYYFGFTYSFMQMLFFSLILIYLLYFCDLYFFVMIVVFIGYFFKVQFSLNLFDYLIDPMLWIYSIMFLFRRFVSNVK